ncbi:hypothetical protein [Methylobacterium soli]|nr:hypothetical protein [Methylobacterium soli]GJE42184.1 hypothetical protein AEGHOMDF_1355 [Methylobacterium soli]
MENLSFSNQINQLTQGWGQIAIDLVEADWTPYLLVLKFHHLSGGRREAVLAQMHREATRAYDWLATRVWRNPRAEAYWDRQPRWILAPDLPVAKRAKVSVRSLVPNGGLHLQGVAVMPPGSRLTEGLDQHLTHNSARYCRPGSALESLYATLITDDLPYVHKYNLKTLERGRAEFDDMLLLPRSRSEVRFTPRRASQPWQSRVFDRG